MSEKGQKIMGKLKIQRAKRRSKMINTKQSKILICRYIQYKQQKSKDKQNILKETKGGKDIL